MRITTKKTIDIATGLVLEHLWYEHFGFVSIAKGASSQQDILAQQQADFYKTMSQAYSTQFSNQSAILNSLRSAWEPILAAGPGQFGFTPEETAALRTQATEGTATEYASAAKTFGEQIAAQGGGNTLLPSGATAQIEGQIATAAAADESNKQLGITEAGYNQGLSLFEQASSVLGGAANIYNPLGYAGASTSAGNSAFNAATTIQNENSSSGLFGTIGGILGGVAGSFLGPVGTALGSQIGSKIGGGGKGTGGGGGPFGGGDPLAG